MNAASSAVSASSLSYVRSSAAYTERVPMRVGTARNAGREGNVGAGAAHVSRLRAQGMPVRCRQCRPPADPDSVPKKRWPCDRRRHCSRASATVDARLAAERRRTVPRVARVCWPKQPFKEAAWATIVESSTATRPANLQAGAHREHTDIRARQSPERTAFRVTLQCGARLYVSL